MFNFNYVSLVICGSLHISFIKYINLLSFTQLDKSLSTKFHIISYNKRLYFVLLLIYSANLPVSGADLALKKVCGHSHPKIDRASRSRPRYSLMNIMAYKRFLIWLFPFSRASVIGLRNENNH